MPTPTGPISLADVQAEFGGPTPIQISNYYLGGAYVPAGTVDGGYGLPPTSGAVNIGQLRNLRKFAPASGSRTLNNTSTVAGNKSVTISLKADGTTTQITSAGTTNGANWGNPTTANIGANYWCRMVPGSNSQGTFTGTQNTWIQLTSGANFGYQTNSATVEANGTFTVQIAASSGGTVLAVLTCTCDVGQAH